MQTIPRLEKENRELKRKLKLCSILTYLLPLFQHDITNRLIIMKGYIEFLELGIPIDKGEIKAMKIASEKMKGLVDLLSGFSEEEKWLNVEEIFNKAVFSSAELGENIKIENNCKALYVLTNSAMLTEIFYSLIDDSLFHNPRQPILIKMGYEKRKEKTAIIYQDNGIGVPDNEKDKIFFEGYGKRTGKGLFLIKKICEINDWEISEEGTHGKGAEFVILIPKKYVKS